MKRYRQIIVVVVVILLFISLNTVTVYAGNDGNALSDPFGDCGASISFGGDAKYYDFLIPYNLTFKDVGGYASNVTFDAGSAYAGWNMVPSSSDIAKKVGTLNRQGSKGSSWLGLSVKIDSDTGFEYVEAGGCKFYIASLPKAPFNYSAVTQEGFYQWAYLAATGIIYDMILKDGTVIHFATGDGVGTLHSNNDTSDSVYSGGQDGVNIQFAKLNYPQYKHLFHASQPNHTFECFCQSGALTKFKSFYGISDSNPIVAIRMWNKSIKALTQGGSLTVNPGFSGLSSKGNAISGSVSRGPMGDNSQFVSGYFDELDLATYIQLLEPNLQEYYLQYAQRTNLGQNELESLTDWERNHQMTLEEHGYIAILRKAVMIVGIVITIWAIFVYLAFWFDHINTFFYLDALHIVTLGQLHICPPGDKPTFSVKEKVKTRTVSHAQIIGICAIAILFGTLLISGVFYTIVSRFVNMILRFIGGG